jgi:hypothetical protein
MKNMMGCKMQKVERFFNVKAGGTYSQDNDVSLLQLSGMSQPKKSPLGWKLKGTTYRMSTTTVQVLSRLSSKV